MDIRLDTDALADAMRAAVTSQTELAAKAGISRQHLSRVMGGYSGASPAVIRALAKALRVPARQIIVGDRPARTGT